MKWYHGNIPSAIQEARRNASMFIVYISGQDDLSKKMDATWEDPEVSGLCEQARSVGIKLLANSEECAQFSQIYPVVCVPCTFFIGGNGAPVEVTGGAVEPKDFIATIRKARQMNDTQLQGGSSSQTPASVQTSDVGASSGGAASASSALATTPTEAQPQAEQAFYEPVVSTPSYASSSETGAGMSSNLSKEERVERAKEAIAQKREEKARQKKEKEKEEELERRKTGQDMVKLKQWKAEQEAKELKEHMRKEREEEKRARERVREQIARDRAERAEKFQKEKHEADVAKQQAQTTRSEAQAQKQAQQDAARREIARLQFRLPDGSSITQQFPSCDCLGSAREFLEQQVGNRFGYFEMSTLYPKRSFTDADMTSSLLDLNLAPSAVVVILPGSRTAAVSRPGGSGGDSFIWMLLAPLVALWNFVYNLLFGAPAQPSRPPPPPQEASGQSEPQPTTHQSNPHPRNTRPKSSYGLRSRQEGNVRRFTSEDDEDESATWNGNSTQQM